MKTKNDIVHDWLPRYTGQPVDAFSPYILLTNFQRYVDLFVELTGARVVNPAANMPCATAGGMTMVNFGMGSPNAATVMDLLSAVQPLSLIHISEPTRQYS